MPSRSAAAVLSLGVAAAAIVYTLQWAPPFLLMRAVPWLPRAADPWLLSLAVQVVLLLAFALAFKAPLLAMAVHGAGREGWRAVFWFLSGGAVLALIGAVTVVSTSDALATNFTVSDGVRNLARHSPVSGAVGGALRTFLLGPIYEEFLFRLFVLGYLLRAAPPWLALLTSTALFASLHPSWLISSMSGAAYGLLYLRFRSVWLCIVAHGGSNLFAAMGIPLLVAYLHEAGLLHPVREGLLVIQLGSCAVALACFSRFFREVLGNGKARAVLLASSTLN